MSNISVFCIATSHSQAEIIAALLKSANIPNADISVLLPDKDSVRDFEHEMHTKGPEAAAAGGVLGGALGWIAGIGALAIPGVGPFIAAGPLMVALSAAAVGAAVGGITGGLIGFGIPESQAKFYEGQLKAGNVLIAVHTDDVLQIAHARDIFDKAGAMDICTPGETSLLKGSQPSEGSPQAVWPALIPFPDGKSV